MFGTSIRLVAIVSFSAIVASSNVAFAQVEEGDGGKARISLAGKLRTLAQIIDADSCYIENGIAIDATAENLTHAYTDYAHILAALKDGDVGLGVPSGEDLSTALKAMDEIGTIWQDVGTAAKEISENTNVAANAEIIRQNDSQLLEMSELLLSLISAKYTNPNSVNQRDAVAINIASRQRMFTQKLRKLACEISGDTQNATLQEDLAQTMELFEISLIALRDGLPAAGVRTPPNDGIREELERAWERWVAVKAELTSVAATGSANLEEIAVVSDALLLNMDNVVTRYLLSIPGSEDIFRIPLQAYAESELAPWFDNPVILAALKAQNEKNAGIAQADIDALDQQWRAETKEDSRPFIDQVMGQEGSLYLIEKQNQTAGFVTEVFVMDNVGLNVVQSGVTSDYWQGDEDKWQLTYDDEEATIHISEAEFDDSTQAYQAQVSLPIYDPETNEKIGAVTIGVNLQFLL